MFVTVNVYAYCAGPLLKHSLPYAWDILQLSISVCEGGRSLVLTRIVAVFIIVSHYELRSMVKGMLLCTHYSYKCVCVCVSVCLGPHIP